MADFHALLRAYRDASRPDTARLEAVRHSLRRPRRRPVVPVLLVGAALAASAFFGLRRPETIPLAGAQALSSLVHTVSEGEGEAVVAGTEFALAWRRGTLDVSVEPDAGVRLSVVTDEGTIRVVGTEFEVKRDALGTTVSVSHGTVEADCAVGGPLRVPAGSIHTCPPRTAAGALGRVHALEDAGVSPDVILTDVEAALARPDTTDAVAQELASTRVSLLVALHRESEAIAAAEEALARGTGGRDLELHRAAGRLHVHDGRCAEALPHLQALAAANDLGPDAALLTRCSLESP